MTKPNRPMHTPGPLHVEACPEHGGKHPLHDSRYVRSSSGDYVCTMRDTSTQFGDAHLIAAAPDLLMVGISMMELMVWTPPGGCSDSQRDLFQWCMNIIASTTDTLSGGKIGRRKAIADRANAALDGRPWVLSGVSTREDLIYWLGSVDRNGVWSDDDMLAEGLRPMTLDEAWTQVDMMVSDWSEVYASTCPRCDRDWRNCTCDIDGGE